MKYLTILLIIFFIPLPVSAEPPNILHYQGQLVSIDDNAPVSEVVPMTFRLYSDHLSEAELITGHRSLPYSDAWTAWYSRYHLTNLGIPSAMGVVG